MALSRCRGLLEFALSPHRDLAIAGMGAVAAWLGSFRSLLAGQLPVPQVASIAPVPQVANSLLADAPDQRKLLHGVLGEHTKLQQVLHPTSSTYTP